MTIPFTPQNPDASQEIGGAPAVVQTGTVNFTDKGGNFFDMTTTDNQQILTPTIWTDCYVANRYENDKHRYMMPITSPTPFQGKSVAFCQLAAPTMLWISDWTVQRTGTVPDIPDPELVPDDWVLMDVHYDPAPLKVSRDGRTPIYRVSGTYVYGSQNPPTQPHQAVLFARLPWIDPSQYSRTIPDDVLTGSIIGGAAVLVTQ